MKILQLAKYYPPIYGGIELVEKMMTKSHSENNDSVVIHAFDKEFRVDHGEFNEKIDRVKEDFNFLGAPFNIRYFLSFKERIKNENVNRIYVHLPNPYMHELVRLNINFIRKNNIELIAVYHSDIINKGILGKIYNLYFKKTASIYDKIIVSSNNLWNSSNVLNTLPIFKKIVLPFCIEESPITVQSSHSGKKKLISIGRLVPYKGFEFLIETYNNTEFELNIIGNGPLLNVLKKKCAANVKIITDLKHVEKNEMLAASQFLVVGSINNAEAYGMTIVEAFYYNVPVIAPKLNTGVSFLVQDSVTGYQYDVLDKEMLISKTREAFSNQLDQQKIKENIKNFYINNLSYNSFRKGLLNI